MPRETFAPLPIPAWPLLVQQLRRRRLPAVLHAEQEDLVSEALLRALASPPPDGHWDPWVNRIFSNVALDRLRVLTRAARAQTLLTYAPGGTPESPEDKVLAHERQRKLHAAVESLPPSLHRAVQARFFNHADEKPQAATARVHVHRGIARLRGLLSSLRAMIVPVYAPVATGAVAVVVLTQVAVSPPATPRMIAAANETSVPAHRAMMAEASSRPRRLMAEKPNQGRPPAQPPATATDGTQTPQVFDFDDDTVEGSLNAADMTLVHVPLVAKHDSLLEIPATMIEPLLKSLEDI